MDWLHPSYAWALAAVPVVAVLWAYALRARRQALGRLGERHLLAALGAEERPRGYRLRAILLVLAVLLLALALTGPRYGLQQRQVERRGIDLVVALDVSQSMLAEDVAPSRLERAKRAIGELLDEMRGGRVGLVIFAGDAFIQTPLTTDYNAVRLFLDVAGPELIATPGTNFAAALQMAERAFTTSEQDVPSSRESSTDPVERSRALLFVSDGENHVAGLDAVRREAREAGITLFAAGVGETSGAPIPLYANGRRAGYKRDQEGQIVSTRLEEAALRALAREGAYVRIGAGGDALAELPEALGRLQPATFRAETFETYAEQYQWPLGLALVLLVAERFLPVLRTKPAGLPDLKVTGET